MTPPAAHTAAKQSVGKSAGPRRRRASRGALLLATLLMLTLALFLLFGRENRTGYLDPAAVDPSGSRAVANVLTNNGVSVHPSTDTAAVLAKARDAAVLVTQPGLLTTSVVTDLIDASPARVILVGDYPGSPAMTRLAAGVKWPDGEPDDAEVLSPSCDFPPALLAGAARLPGVRYDARGWVPRAQACYDRAASAALVVLPASEGRPEVVLLGSPAPLTNDGFNDEGNASLSLSLLGSRSNLLWWQPTADDPAISGSGGQKPLLDLLPAWVVPVVVQLFVCALALAWWRSRRMGPLVIEPLPVVVRAGETTAGRARLLQANHARGTAAELLREQGREQLRVTLGLPVGCTQEALLSAAQGRTELPVSQLLYGPLPTTDRQLVQLQADLTKLVQELRRS